MTMPMCQNGEELAWISGDSESDYPAPRILVLPEDHPPAATIDEVAADAPGRDQLTEMVDTDHPAATTTTTTTTLPAETTTPPPVADDAPLEEALVEPVEETAGPSPLLWGALAAAVVGAAALIVRRVRP